MIEDKYLSEEYIRENIFAKFPIERPEMETGFFWYRINPVTGLAEFHPALDMISQGGHRNLFSVTSGTCIANGEDSTGKGGNFIKIRYNYIDGRKWDGTYYHMAKKSPFKVGEYVHPGIVVGEMGKTGSQVTGIHLHMEVEMDGRKIDPKLWLENLRLIAENRRYIRRLRELGDNV